MKYLNLLWFSPAVSVYGFIWWSLYQDYKAGDVGGLSQMILFHGIVIVIICTIIGLSKIL